MFQEFQFQMFTETKDPEFTKKDLEFKIFHYTEVETSFWNKFLVLVFVLELFDNWSFTLTLGKFIDYILLNFDYHTNDKTIEQGFSPGHL